jgi:hypothetical protein
MDLDRLSRHIQDHSLLGVRGSLNQPLFDFSGLH